MKFFLLFFSITTFLLAEVKINLSHTDIKHGTSFAVILQSDKNLSQAPNVIFKDKTYQMFTINGSIQNYEVFLPVDYHNPKQKENVQVFYEEKNKLIKKNISINIIDGKYRQNEIIKVPKGKVTLSDKNKEKTAIEYDKVFKNVYSVVTLYDLTNNSTFELPMNSKITSAFGNARVYNGVAKSYHTGTDFRASVGDEVKASNDGKVVLTMDRFYLGKVIYIDHGRGAYTYYSHLSKILVKEGDMVKKGQIIAKSGKTGRITGPHLHYAVRLYNTTVDPLQYTSLYNDIVKKYH
jgi:murein DD-endopeptidase MepM/ murein hydrolase activator NlpD